jgi:hypothetical protein
MEAGNQELVFDLVQAALAEAREGEEGEEDVMQGLDGNERYQRLQRRFERLGFTAAQIRHGATAAASLDPMTVLDTKDLIPHKRDLCIRTKET